jgi:AmiR/NasT family two-component response regulator
VQDRAAAQARLLNEQLTEALNSRIVIEQAKGVLAERSSLDMAEAFSRLRTYARNNNLRLADVAADVISGAVSTAMLERSGRARR